MLFELHIFKMAIQCFLLISFARRATSIGLLMNNMTHVGEVVLISQTSTADSVGAVWWGTNIERGYRAMNRPRKQYTIFLRHGVGL